jgi:glycine/D-amino acid oxidase-like deaminating enzyme
VIVGGGMAGLSAAWWLEKRGFRDYVVLEMEKETGGNSRFGENAVSAHPWGAHYLPVPNRKSPLVRELCEELGLLENGQWNERHLCHSPQERLFVHGRWQYGLEPEVARNSKVREQRKRFDEIVEKLHANGQWTIPHSLGRVDATLEKTSFAQWLQENRFDAPELLWYLDYSTRDDYGSSLSETSAWAGLHYFAARDFDDEGPFTWPEGNGWILRALRRRAAARIETESPVYRARRQGQKWELLTPRTKYLASAVIWAAPSFLAQYIVEGQQPMVGLSYSPWIVANLSLDRWPHQAPGPEYAWDNVIYGSPSLGYVVATHQNLAMHREKTVWTWYYALAEMAPAAGRKLLLEKPWEYWRDRALADLSRPHPDIADCVSRIDVFRNGHAMVRPTVGGRTVKAQPGIYFANSDVSGISIFEEAQYRGVEAAKGALSRLSRA